MSSHLTVPGTAPRLIYVHPGQRKAETRLPSFIPNDQVFGRRLSNAQKFLYPHGPFTVEESVSKETKSVGIHENLYSPVAEVKEAELLDKHANPARFEDTILNCWHETDPPWVMQPV